MTASSKKYSRQLAGAVLIAPTLCMNCASGKVFCGASELHVGVLDDLDEEVAVQLGAGHAQVGVGGFSGLAVANWAASWSASWKAL